MNRALGSFVNHGTGLMYITLSSAPIVVGIPAHEITAAVSDGSLPVQEVSGFKAVALNELFRYIESKAG